MQTIYRYFANIFQYHFFILKLQSVEWNQFTQNVNFTLTLSMILYKSRKNYTSFQFCKFGISIRINIVSCLWWLEATITTIFIPSANKLSSITSVIHCSSVTFLKSFIVEEWTLTEVITSNCTCSSKSRIRATCTFCFF